jgi:O-antigen/teichoic acid export membrane protein
MKSPSLKRNYLFNTILLSANILFPLITFPYITRILGPIGVGKVQFVQAFADYFRLFASLGIPLYGLREIARVRNDPDNLRRTFSELIIISFAANVIAVAVYASLFAFIPKMQIDKDLFLVFGAYVFLNFLSLDWFFQGIEDYRIITIRSIAVKIATVIAIILVIKKEEDFTRYGAVVMLSFAAANVLNFFFSQKKAHLRFTGLNLSRHFSGILKTFLMAVIVKLYIGLDKIMIGFISGDEFVGYYALGEKVVRILLVLVTSLSTVLLPRVSNLFETGQEEKFHELLGKSIRFMFAIGIPMTIGTIVLAPNLSSLFGGEKFEPSVNALRLLSLMILPSGFASIAGLQILYASGREKSYLVSLLAGSVVALTLNLLLIPKYKHVGAAAATAIASYVGVLIQCYFARIELRGKIFTLGNGKILAGSAVIAGFLLLIYPYLSKDGGDIGKISIAVAGSGVLYIVSLLLFRESNFLSYLQIIRLRLFSSRK